MSIVKIVDVCEQSKTGMIIQVGNLESFKKRYIQITGLVIPISALD